MKVTRGMLEIRLKQLLELNNACLADDYNEVGRYQLDANYGGYVVELITTSSGAVQVPFGYTRMSARELYEKIDFAIDVMKHFYDK